VFQSVQDYNKRRKLVLSDELPAKMKEKLLSLPARFLGCS
jgi:hypothetical protein